MSVTAYEYQGIHTGVLKFVNLFMVFLNTKLHITNYVYLSSRKQISCKRHVMQCIQMLGCFSSYYYTTKCKYVLLASSSTSSI